MQYNTQTDHRWANDIMTKKDGKWIDTIWRYGCLVTSLANIMQRFENQEVTPKMMNSFLVKNFCYKYLKYPETKESEASFLLWDEYKKLCRYEINLMKTYLDYKPQNQYIARIIHNLTGAGHYINVVEKIDNNFLCFDVENSKLIYLAPEKITFLHEFIKK